MEEFIKTCSLHTYSRDAISEILKILDLKSDDSIMVPDYICIEVVESINKFTNNIISYSINSSLLFNENEIKVKAGNNVKAIIFVDFFGNHCIVSDDLKNFMKTNNIVAIRDAAHSFLTHFESNFSMNNQFDYFFTSIYKNLNTHVGSLLHQNKVKIKSKISFRKYLSRFVIDYAKFFLEHTVLINSKDKFNMPIIGEVKEKHSLLLDINFARYFLRASFNKECEKTIKNRRMIAISMFECIQKIDGVDSVYSLDQLKANILMAMPIKVENFNLSKNLLRFFRSKGINSHRWPTFHPNIVNYELSKKIILLPIELKVNRLLESNNQNVLISKK